MDSLQIQDAFQPYYASDRSAEMRDKTADLAKRPHKANPDDVRRRLQECRDRLAKALAVR